MLNIKRKHGLRSMIILPNISQYENAAKDDGNMGVITSGNAQVWKCDTTNPKVANRILMYR
jgi:hypothetical protein